MRAPGTEVGGRGGRGGREALLLCGTTRFTLPQLYSMCMCPTM